MTLCFKPWWGVGLLLCAACGEGDPIQGDLDAAVPDQQRMDSAAPDRPLADGPRKDQRPLDRAGYDKVVLDKASPDKASPDQAMPDKAMPDARPPDQAVSPDMPPPDQTSPDQAVPPDMPITPDQAMPDKAIPDQAMPDQAIPDQAIPDQAMPDKAIPDQAMPDKAPPDFPLPDSAILLPDTHPSADAPLPVPYTGSFPKGTGSQTATLTVAGYARKVSLYLPSGLGTKPPLLITFHGTNGSSSYMITASFAKDLANSKKVIIASPQARKMTVGDWDNHYPNDIYWETHPNTDPNTNPDLLLVRAMIQEAQQAYNVDPRRIYTLGHSSGGFFSILSAMTLPYQIAGFVSNSAGLVRCPTMQSCSFTGTATTCAGLALQPGYCSCSGVEKPGPVAVLGRKPPGYLAHSNDDTAVSIYYTCELASRMSSLGYALSLNIYTYNGHSMPHNLAINGWSFLSQYKLP